MTEYIVTNIETGEADIIEATPETIAEKVEEIAIDTHIHLENFHWEKGEDDPETLKSLKDE